VADLSLSLCFNETYAYGCHTGTVNTPVFKELLPYLVGSKGTILLILQALLSTESSTLSLLNPNKGSTPYLVGKPAPKQFILSHIHPQP
jgi:hypothetical protein